MHGSYTIRPFQIYYTRYHSSYIISIGRYIFNCGEGVTRLVTANRIRLTSVEHMFFTQAKWRHVGGLGSLLMSFLENRKSLIVLHGAEPLSAIVRRIMASLNLLQHCGMCKFNETTDRFEDAHLRVDFIRLPSKDAATSMAYYGKLKCVHRVQLNGFRVRMTPEDAEDEDVINQSYDEPRDFDFLGKKFNEHTSDEFLMRTFLFASPRYSIGQCALASGHST